MLVREGDSRGVLQLDSARRVVDTVLTWVCSCRDSQFRSWLSRCKDGVGLYRSVKLKVTMSRRDRSDS
jgi:hypothetical protein